MNHTYIYGAGGHGKVVFHTLNQKKQTVVGFIDDNVCGDIYNVPILQTKEIADILIPYGIHFAIGDNSVRSRLQSRWQSMGILAKTAVHLSAVVYPNAIVGRGCLLAAGTVIGPDVKIGQGCIINHNAIVDHDCLIDDFCHVAPGATLGGGVKLGFQCLVGAGAIILPQLTIGRNVTIGAGSVVTRDINANETVIGCPARPLYREE